MLGWGLQVFYLIGNLDKIKSWWGWMEGTWKCLYIHGLIRYDLYALYLEMEEMSKNNNKKVSFFVCG